MTTGKTAVMLINIGTPDSPAVNDVRKYLSEFLNDPRVIDLPWLLRKLLVNLIIVPFRAPKSAKLYKILWSGKGSPLIFHGNRVRDKLQEQLGDSFAIYVAMRYANPNIREVLEQIRTKGFTKIIVVPMFPHYASSSTGSAVEAVMGQLKKWNVIPEVKFVGQFYHNPQFTDAFAERIKACHPEKYDHIVFSYHGLPLSHIASVHPETDCENCPCAHQFPEHGTVCYKATTYKTTRMLAVILNLPNGSYSHSYQSRLSDKWLKPYTDKLLIQKAKEGIKNILVVSPVFIADCLETTVELGIDYKNQFIVAGGQNLEYVESLNDMPAWIDLLKRLIENA